MKTCSSEISIFSIVVLFTASVAFEQTLSRKERYVSFPDGSSVAATICLTIGMIGNPNRDYISWAENWGVAYDLPNYKWARDHANGFRNQTKSTVQRRFRRDLYDQMQMAMERLGFHGTACIKRALCESARFLNPLKKGNMMTEILKILFSLPNDQQNSAENSLMREYDAEYHRARRETTYDCRKENIHCNMSLLDLVFGKYSAKNEDLTLSFTNMAAKSNYM